FSGGLNVEFVPDVGQQLADAAVRVRWKTAEQIAQIGKRASPARLALAARSGR
ncbi:hypothetical protein HYR69_06460, partial [Candidatus Sumerlaeota bacterium]|nr:hypothetical protein [Candidatus Sumerlaeota bacterium]